MTIEFQILSLQIHVKERLSEKKSEKIQLATLCELEEHWITSLIQLELEQRRRKAFVDKHRRSNEKEFNIRKPVLVFQTRMGSLLRKLRFWWTGPFWVTREFNGSYQLGTLAEELLSKWVNGFRLKPYKGQMSENLFKDKENPQNTGNRIKGSMTPEVTDSVEPGTTGKQGHLILKKQKKLSKEK